MVLPLWETILSDIDTEHLLRQTERIWQSDRVFTFPNFQRTADYVTAELSALGLKAVMETFPADGRTQVWMGHAAGVGRGGRLPGPGGAAGAGRPRARLVEGDAQFLVMWSGPLAGVSAELVSLPDDSKAADWDRMDLRARSSWSAVTRRRSRSRWPDAASSPLSPFTIPA